MRLPNGCQRKQDAPVDAGAVDAAAVDPLTAQALANIAAGDVNVAGGPLPGTAIDVTGSATDPAGDTLQTTYDAAGRVTLESIDTNADGVPDIIVGARGSKAWPHPSRAVTATGRPTICPAHGTAASITMPTFSAWAPA